MKKNLTTLIAVAFLTLILGSWSWSTCPEDANDRGECDTLNVICLDCEQDIGSGPYTVRFPILITHDQISEIDSVAGVSIPLTYTHTNPSAYCSVSSYWSTTTMLYIQPDFARSIFRHMMDGPDTLYANRMAQLEGDFSNRGWDHVTLDFDTDSSWYHFGINDSIFVPPQFWLTVLASGPQNQRWWEGERTLLATMTFIIEDTMHVCMDTTFWPPELSLQFARSDAVEYCPRHSLPQCFRIGPAEQSCWYWNEDKPAQDFPAPSGMPDFDQNQSDWELYDAPTAAANCLWWFDTVPDGLTPPQLIDMLAIYFHTSPIGGTWVDSMQLGLEQYLQDYAFALKESTFWQPDFFEMNDSLERSQSIVLLLGFWQEIQPGEWNRMGGHYVTVSGMCAESLKIALSDPDRDAAVNGLPGRVRPPEHPPSGYPPTLHNDPTYVSHDMFQSSLESPCPGNPNWELSDYFEPYTVVVEYAVLISESSPDFVMNAEPDTQEIQVGDSAVFDLRLTSLFGFDSPCTLSVSGLPPDASAQLDDIILIPTDSTVLRISTEYSTPPGDYDLTVTAQEMGGSFIQHSIDVTLVLLHSDTLWVFAYSPVDLIVTDPVGDSIGLDFTTIQDATYDTLVDLNEDGDNDDSVTIPHCLVGDYLIRVIPEPDAVPGDTYSVGIRIDGSMEAPLIVGAGVPPPGESDSLTYESLSYLRGDVTQDNEIELGDLLFLLSYLYKGGLAPEPLELGDVNWDEIVELGDVLYLISYLYKGGPPPSS